MFFVAWVLTSSDYFPCTLEVDEVMPKNLDSANNHRSACCTLLNSSYFSSQITTVPVSLCIQHNICYNSIHMNSLFLLPLAPQLLTETFMNSLILHEKKQQCFTKASTTYIMSDSIKQQEMPPKHMWNKWLIPGC